MNNVKILVVSSVPTKKNPTDCIFVHRWMKTLMQKGAEITIFPLGIRHVPKYSELPLTGFHEHLYARALSLLLNFVCMLITNPSFSFKMLKKVNLADATLILGSSYKITRIIRRGNFDFLFAHFAYPGGLIGAIVKDISKVRLVIAVYGRDIATVEDVKYGITLNPIYRDLVSYSLRDSDLILAISEDAKKNALKLCADATKIFTTYLGVDVKKFNPSLREHEHTKQIRNRICVYNDSLVVLFMGNLIPRKGVTYLIEAIPHVLKRVPNVEFIIAGDGPLFDKLKHRIRELEIEHRTHLCGAIEPADACFLFAGSDLFVLPSLHEGFGEVLVEAMSTGVPVVATTAGAIPEVVEDGVSGILVRPKDIGMLIQAVVSLLKNEKMRLKFGRACRKRVEKFFTWDACARRTLEAFAGINQRTHK